MYGIQGNWPQLCHRVSVGTELYFLVIMPAALAILYWKGVRLEMTSRT